MSTHADTDQIPLAYDGDGEDGTYRVYGGSNSFGTADYPDEMLPRPINWNLLTAEEAMAEWADLDAWVTWLRQTYGLPPAVIPPLWHRHDELVWELSALHTHWLNAYDPDGNPSGPLGWHRDFAEARQRLRDWVSTSGSRLDRDRPTRQTKWPGEPTHDSAPEAEIADRYADFLQFVNQDVTARRRIEDHARALVNRTS